MTPAEAVKVAAKVPYDLPAPAALPDLSDDKVFAECRKRAEVRERETRRTRRLYWLHQLFPWL